MQINIFQTGFITHTCTADVPTRFSLVLVNDRCSEKIGSQAIFEISDALGVIDVIIGAPCPSGEPLPEKFKNAKYSCRRLHVEIAS